jgi:hypothetical protein
MLHHMLPVIVAASHAPSDSGRIDHMLRQILVLPLLLARLFSCCRGRLGGSDRLHTVFSTESKHDAPGPVPQHKHLRCTSSDRWCTSAHFTLVSTAGVRVPGAWCSTTTTYSGRSFLFPNQPMDERSEQSKSGPEGEDGCGWGVWFGRSPSPGTEGRQWKN